VCVCVCVCVCVYVLVGQQKCTFKNVYISPLIGLAQKAEMGAITPRWLQSTLSHLPLLFSYAGAARFFGVSRQFLSSVKKTLDTVYPAHRSCLSERLPTAQKSLWYLTTSSCKA
jgi:hypothetical protein